MDRREQRYKNNTEMRVLWTGGNKDMKTTQKCKSYLYQAQMVALDQMHRLYYPSAIMTHH